MSQATRYHLVLDAEQLACYIQGLEFFSRWCAGQTDHLPETLLHKRYDPTEMQYLLDRVQRELFPDLRPGSHHGLRVIPGDPVQRAAVVSYEMYRCARHFLTVHAGHNNVYTSPTLPRTGLDLPEIRQIGYCVYWVRNLKNGNGYVGCTQQQPLKRLRQHLWEAAKGRHRTPFYEALNKYGQDAFDLRILESYASEEEMLAGEIFWASQVDSTYNIPEALGRRSPMKNPEVSRRVAQSKTGTAHSPATRQLMSSQRTGLAKESVHRNRIAAANGARTFAVYRVGENTPLFERQNVRGTATELGLHHKCVEHCLKGKQKTTGGFYFRYINAPDSADPQP